MDRAVSSEFIQKQRGKAWLYTLLEIAALAAAVWGLRSALSNSLQRSEIRTAVVERGDVDNTIQASGEVQPELEQVITSPIAAILQQADIVATRAGVLTYVNLKLGTKVSEGEILARIADLRSFKILGSISDSYSSKMHTGMPVIVRANDSTMRGTLVNIHPAVSNSVVTFDVALDDQKSSKT